MTKTYPSYGYSSYATCLLSYSLPTAAFTHSHRSKSLVYIPTSTRSPFLAFHNPCSSPILPATSSVSTPPPHHHTDEAEESLSSTRHSMMPASYTFPSNQPVLSILQPIHYQPTSLHLHSNISCTYNTSCTVLTTHTTKLKSSKMVGSFSTDSGHYSV
jgi:hypothetical protein